MWKMGDNLMKRRPMGSGNFYCNDDSLSYYLYLYLEYLIKEKKKAQTLSDIFEIQSFDASDLP